MLQYGYRPDGEVETRESAKLLCAGPIPAPASQPRPVGVERSEDHDFCPSPRAKQHHNDFKILRYFDILIWIIYGRINNCR